MFSILYRIRKYGALNYIYECCQCSSLFKNNSDILTHIETHFNDEVDPIQNDFEYQNADPVNGVESQHEINGRMRVNEDVIQLCDQSDDLHHHINTAEYHCKFCNHSTEDNMLSHLIEEHLSETELTCSICCEAFISKTTFQNHLLDHTVRKDVSYVSLIEDIVLKCDNCNEICVQLEVEEYLPNSENVELLQCDICESNFDTKIKLSLHMQKVHVPKKDVEKKGMHMCEKCNRNIKGKLLFYAHQYEHLNGGSRLDDTDDVILLHNLKVFLKTNIQYDELTPETPYGCKLCCHLSVKRRKNIETHILQEHIYRLRTDRTEKRYSCEYCGQKFTLSHNMIVHKRIHTHERPYKCNICNKSFSHSSYMKYHEKVHSGIRSHQCSTCGLSFKSITKLNMHTKVHSTETAKCPVCDKEFKPHRLNVHIKHVHQNEHRPYKCTVCQQAFKTSKTLKTHSYRHSGEKKYMCRFQCNKRFTSTAGRRGHERSKHETH